jgi:hypothetical protein
VVLLNLGLPDIISILIFDDLRSEILKSMFRHQIIFHGYFDVPFCQEIGFMAGNSSYLSLAQGNDNE